jgi:hypothetical protein
MNEVFFSLRAQSTSWVKVRMSNAKEKKENLCKKKKYR